MEDTKFKFISPKAEKGVVVEDAKSAPVVDRKRKLVFVNGVKYRRAQDILDIVLGKKPVTKAADIERKEHYTKQLQAHNVELEGEDALPALYEILGGLIRTESEHREANENAQKEKAKGKKRMIV